MRIAHIIIIIITTYDYYLLLVRAKARKFARYIIIIIHAVLLSYRRNR